MYQHPFEIEWKLLIFLAILKKKSFLLLKTTSFPIKLKPMDLKIPRFNLKNQEYKKSLCTTQEKQVFEILTERLPIFAEKLLKRLRKQPKKSINIMSQKLGFQNTLALKD